MKHILLLGAGFSRNWGGWLATEVFEYLLGSRHVVSNEYLRGQLWRTKDRGGFEAALAAVRSSAIGYWELKDDLDAFEVAIAEMFSDMNRVFERATFEFSNQREMSVTMFLAQFDAIFTLNQDMLLEIHYIGSENVALLSQSRVDGTFIPGVQLQPWAGPVDYANSVWNLTDDWTIPPRMQPYIKLHGSSRWGGGPGRDVLVMGDDKDAHIRAYPLLRWYKQMFVEYLNSPDCRLMVIGYGFRDAHINSAILAAKANGLRMFVVDPLGVDVVNKTSGLAIRAPDPLEELLIGASRRSLREIFSSDPVENAKVARFFHV